MKRDSRPRDDHMNTLSDTPNQPTVSSDRSSEFEIPGYHKRKMKRRTKAIVGTGQSSDVRGAPEPNRDIFVFRIDPEINTDNIKTYMNKKGTEVREITLMSKDGSKFHSFKVSIKLSDLNTVMNSEYWPAGVNVRRFWQPRKSVTQSWNCQS